MCYICGDEKLVEEYKSQVIDFLNQDYIAQEHKEQKGVEEKKEKYQGLKNHRVRALKVLEEGTVEINYLKNRDRDAEESRQSIFQGDLAKLAPVFGEASEGNLFDVKQEIYRLPDRMIYNLGMFFGIYADSAWNIIDELERNKIINSTAATNLRKAITFATNLRLVTYSHNKGQGD